MPKIKLLKAIKYLTFSGIIVTSAIGAYIYFSIIPNLPTIDSVRDVQLQVPMRIYSHDQQLIAEYGEKKRNPLRYDETPKEMINAILAAEDDRFFQHPGVDYQGILRAVFTLVTTGEKSQGGSTITMQVIRNYFLSREKTYLRKVNEILLSLKIERALSKEEILELYINKIFLGHRSYGFGAAAYTYYGKPIDQLTTAQLAMLAGLPKAPSAYNPIANIERATLRRNYVLRRMFELGYIDQAALNEAISTDDNAKLHAKSIELKAPYIAEMVRSELVRQHGNDAYTRGLKVYTTLNSTRQRAANTALQTALLDYERRHGYRGAIGNIPITEDLSETLDEQLKTFKTHSPLQLAVVSKLEEQQATVVIRKFGEAVIDWKHLKWARLINKSTGNKGPQPHSADQILKPGDVIEVQQLKDGKWALAQTPQIEGAFVSLNPTSGAVQSLVGGYNFSRSKFNRAFQGSRQPGSNFKPFIYTAALDKGYTPATLINDAPVVFDDDALETTWRPENYSGKFFGPTRMREALIYSRNLVSIRILQDIGIRYAIGYSQRFGIDPSHLPKDLSLALGSASTSPLEIATGYAVFANGGYKVKPYFISRITDSQGEILFQANPKLACSDCLEEFSLTTNAGDIFAPQVISPQTIYQINSILKDVVKRGTGRRALTLGRNDLHGKTGTTNDQFDAWFSGYSPAQVATAWVGFDQPQALGNRETGGRAALPMWIDYMRDALSEIPNHTLPKPSGMTTVRIDPVSGKLAVSGGESMFETFRSEHTPTEGAPSPIQSAPEVIIDDPSQPQLDEPDQEEELF